MIVRLALWSLADSPTTVGELRRVLRDGAADEAADVGGLRLRLWVADESTERWGLFSLYDSLEAADAEAPGRAGELIGRPPDVFEEFDLEASVEGRLALGGLSFRGLAFED